MKNTILILGIFFLFTLISCGGSGNYPATAEGFSAIQGDINKEFGADAYFTDLSITYNEAVGNIISVTVTADPESLEMGQWNQMQGAWQQNSEVFLELPPNTKAVDFMYQLGNEIDLNTLGSLVQKSKDQLRKDKKLDSAILSIASVQFPDNGDFSEAKYLVNLEPENGGTSFSFYYDLEGNLLDMDY